MTNLAKILTTSAMVLALGACATADRMEAKAEAVVAEADANLADAKADRAEMKAMKAEKEVEEAKQKAMMAEKKAMMAEKEAEAKMMKAEKKAMMVENPMVGGAPMMANKTIVQNASKASNLTTLVAAVKQAQLVDTLSGPGPFTVFAPTDAAFAALPADVTSSLMMDENRADLQKVLTAHVVAGRVTSADLMMKIKENNGSYTATTVSGDALTFFVSDGKVKISDENGMVATVTTADVMQSNGVVHVVNSVLVPK